METRIAVGLLRLSTAMSSKDRRVVGVEPCTSHGTVFSPTLRKTEQPKAECCLKNHLIWVVALTLTHIFNPQETRAYQQPGPV